MGRGTVVARNGRSLYTVAVDYGEAQRAAQVAAVGAQLDKLQPKIDKQADAIILADGRETVLRQRIAQAFDAYLLALATMGPADPLPSTKDYTAAMKALGLEQAKNAPARFQLAALRMERRNLQRRLAQLAGLTLTVARQMWRVIWEKSSETIAVGSTVALGEMNGEAGPLTVILKPSSGAALAAFGRMDSRELMPPEQAFFNVAVLPGWQKFKPTVRWGTLLAVDYEAQTFNVQLAPAPSSAQGLEVNQAGVLLGVARDEILLDAEGMDMYSFMAGDRVVVRFLGQAWDQPRVVGFLDNPIRGSNHYVFQWHVNPVFDGFGVNPIPYRGAVISSGRVWRGVRQAKATAPDLSRVGYVGIGWDGTPAGIGFEHTTTWEFEPADEDGAYGGDYNWLSFLNDGYGEDYTGLADAHGWGTAFYWNDVNTGTFTSLGLGYDEGNNEIGIVGAALSKGPVDSETIPGAVFSWSTFGWPFFANTDPLWFGYYETAWPLPGSNIIRGALTIDYMGYVKRIDVLVSAPGGGGPAEVIAQDGFFLF